MATYSQLRTEILYKLDVPPTMTGDIRSLVDIVMKRTVDELAQEYKPRELLAVSSAASVTSSTTEIGLFSGSPNFGITEAEFSEVATVTLDRDTSDDVEARALEELSYAAWLQLNNHKAGNERPNLSYTVTPTDTVILRNFPDSGTWSLKCWYYKLPEAISDSGIPPWNKSLHGIIATKTVLQFPHLFQGDRNSLLIQQRQMYVEQYKQFMRSRPGEIKMQPRRALGRSTRGAVWPTERFN